MKSKGSPELVIKNAKLLGRSGVSVEANFGDVLIIESDAFNPALALEQLMRQSLMRVSRASAEANSSWDVSCDALSFAVTAAIFHPLEIDLSEHAEDFTVTKSKLSPIEAHSAARDAAAAQIESLSCAILSAASPGSLLVVGLTKSAASMSFRLDSATLNEKLTDIVGELTRADADRSQITVKLYSADIRTRKDLETAQPLSELCLTQSVTGVDAIAPVLPLIKELSLAERYRTGLFSWASSTSAKLLLIDGLSSYVPPQEQTTVIAELQKFIGEEKICLIFEKDSPGKYLPITAEQQSVYDSRQAEFRRKLLKARVVDWIECEERIAKLFCQLPDARRNGLTDRDFIRSNTRYPCASCAGEGFLKTMLGPFGAVRSVCPNCLTAGFSETVLRVRYKELTFKDLLCNEICSFAELFSAHDELKICFEKMISLGIGDLRLADRLDLVPEGKIKALVINRS